MASSSQISAESPNATHTQPSSQPTNNPPSECSASPVTNQEEMAAVTMTMPSPAHDLSLKTSNLHSSSSPPISPASRKTSRSPLSLDLSSVPGLSTPPAPTNTLIITRLDDPKIFHPASLATIREHISSIAPLNSFSPLKSMCRLIVSFQTEADAIKVRQEIDRTAFTPTNICKCYFGEPTPIGDTTKYLDKPDAGKLFFISPPPSPPVGWESRMEDPPNKHVHADDLAAKLSGLTGKMVTAEPELTEEPAQLTSSPGSASPPRRKWGSMASMSSGSGAGTPPNKMRSRSATLIYDPSEHGESPGLPAVVVETTEDDSDVELDLDGRGPMAHTMRPPLELMQH